MRNKALNLASCENQKMQDLWNRTLKYKRKGSDWKGSKRIGNDGIVDPFFRRVKGSDRRSTFDKRIGIGSYIQKKRIGHISGITARSVSLMNVP